MSEQPPTPPPSAPATVGDVNRAAATERFATWLAASLGTVATLGAILALCALILGAAVWTVDRAEAKGVDAAAGVGKDLAEHKLHEAEHHAWTEKMLLRSDDKLSAVLDGQRVRNPWPEPPPAPPPPILPDGGLR